MNTLDAINRRKSVRSYTGEKIDDETLQKILTAGISAPVGMGKFESVHLTVINNQDILKKIRFGFGPDRDILYGAPTLILVSAQKPAPGYENVTFSNAAGIVENMALAATDLGVGACHIWGAIMALSKNASLVASLKLPEGFIPVCGLIVGKTDETYAERDIDTSRIGVTTLD